MLTWNISLPWQIAHQHLNKWSTNKLPFRGLWLRKTSNAIVGLKNVNNSRVWAITLQNRRLTMFTGFLNTIDTRFQALFKIEALQCLQKFKIQLSSHKVGRESLISHHNYIYFKYKNLFKTFSHESFEGLFSLKPWIFNSSPTPPPKKAEWGEVKALWTWCIAHKVVVPSIKKGVRILLNWDNKSFYSTISPFQTFISMM